jgi:hypothetical protein
MCDGEKKHRRAYNSPINCKVTGSLCVMSTGSSGKSFAANVKLSVCHRTKCQRHPHDLGFPSLASLFSLQPEPNGLENPAEILPFDFLQKLTLFTKILGWYHNQTTGPQQPPRKTRTHAQSPPAHRHIDACIPTPSKWFSEDRTDALVDLKFLDTISGDAVALRDNKGRSLPAVLRPCSRMTPWSCTLP